MARGVAAQIRNRESAHSPSPSFFSDCRRSFESKHEGREAIVSAVERSAVRRRVASRRKASHAAPRKGRSLTVAVLVQIIRAVSEARGWCAYDLAAEICICLDDEERRAWNDLPKGSA